MKTILVINASPLGTRSRAYGLASAAAANVVAAHPGARIVERDLTAIGPSAIGSAYAEAITTGMPFDAPVFAESETLIREIEQSDMLIITTPMHNYTVPASLKLWIDHVLRYGRSFAAVNGDKVGLLADRPTLVIVASGGAVSGATARQPDHLTPYLRDVLATIGIRDVRFVYLDVLVSPDRAAAALVDGTAVIGCDPAFGVGAGVAA